MKFQEIPKVNIAHYCIDVPWSYLEWILQEYRDTYSIDFDPDFQRGYVWTETQQIQYVEWALRGGFSGLDIFWNCIGWNASQATGPIVIVDGKQRINAALRFLRNEIPAYGVLCKDYEDKLDLLTPRFKFHIASLETRAEILNWYISLNTGGTVHTEEEIERVKKLLAKAND